MEKALFVNNSTGSLENLNNLLGQGWTVKSTTAQFGAMTGDSYNSTEFPILVILVK